MKTPAICFKPLSDIVALLPVDFRLAEQLATDSSNFSDEAIHIRGDLHLSALDLDAPLASGSALLEMLDAGQKRQRYCAQNGQRHRGRG